MYDTDIAEDTLQTGCRVLSALPCWACTHRGAAQFITHRPPLCACMRSVKRLSCGLLCEHRPALFMWHALHRRRPLRAPKHLCNHAPAASVICARLGDSYLRCAVHGTL